MIYKKTDITKKLALGLVAEFGNPNRAARAIQKDCRTFNGNVASLVTVRHWLEDAINDRAQVKTTLLSPDEIDKINSIKALLDEANVPVDAIGKIKKVRLGKHAVVTKHPKTGEVSTTYAPNISIELSPTWDDGPAWPVVQPAKKQIVKYEAPRIWIPKGLRTEVVWPDSQIGFQRVLDSRSFDGKTESIELQPMHDPRAIDVALQLTKHISPDGWTTVGDWFDFSEFSKYLQVEEFHRTTQPAIDYGGDLLSKIKSAIGPPRKIRGKLTPRRMRMVDGNHDGKRLATYIQMNARAAFDLRPANSTPGTWPMMSVPYVLNLDELGVEWMGMWPGSEAWLVEGNNGLVVVHDPTKRDDYYASVICGHTHRYDVEVFTPRTQYGYNEFTKYQIGCLCSLERVPSNQRTPSIQRSRVPSDRGNVQRWSQGIALVEILEDTGQHQLTYIRIQNGRATFERQEFRAKEVK